MEKMNSTKLVLILVAISLVAIFVGLGAGHYIGKAKVRSMQNVSVSVKNNLKSVIQKTVLDRFFNAVIFVFSIIKQTLMWWEKRKHSKECINDNYK